MSYRVELAMKGEKQSMAGRQANKYLFFQSITLIFTARGDEQRNGIPLTFVNYPTLVNAKQMEMEAKASEINRFPYS